ncbi:hypothetical protein SR1949_11100 [Sphaerospermopsis reniformis]|jgi:hypothetical protein|uniref:Uncharacterized protein n=1 Tax=Sphaerospermopsis reniformis TaxID=531300 RepID=A0A479ZTJ1_9CYAN|nr:hypothetical protein [Sphaerospermopsis reniformis]GCL36010.1 hypothetical protein SR1949_11100 [Sphaerospermopsis reniformis]
MINSTQTIRLLTIDEAFDSQGVKIVYGECTFSYYSKDGVVEDTIPYRTKGAAAVSIAESGVNATGIAIGYLDLNVVDSGKGYKEKKTTLVIRNFICTATGNRTHTPTVTPVVQPPTPQENTQQLVGAGVATASQNGHSRNTNISDIPF